MDHGKVSSPGREKAKKSKVSGAVANRRQAGDPDTYQCTHCWRVIADNESAKEQHWDSLHCRTKRYQYSGYGDEKTCRKLAKADLAKQTQRWKLKENGSLRGSDPPPEPRGRPSWHRSPSFSKEKRSSRAGVAAGGRSHRSHAMPGAWSVDHMKCVGMDRSGTGQEDGTTALRLTSMVR